MTQYVPRAVSAPLLVSVPYHRHTTHFEYVLLVCQNMGKTFISMSLMKSLKDVSAPFALWAEPVWSLLVSTALETRWFMWLIREHRKQITIIL